MSIIQFTIKGNQEEKLGNPIPYTRTTQKSQWAPKAQRYHGWKDHVRASYIDALEAMPMEMRMKYSSAHDLVQPKPIKKSEHKQRMTLKCFFKDKTHADCDNIFKGIADALFMNDKYLVSDGFDYSYTDKDTGGSVIVTLDL